MKLIINPKKIAAATFLELLESALVYVGGALGIIGAVKYFSSPPPNGTPNGFNFDVAAVILGIAAWRVNKFSVLRDKINSGARKLTRFQRAALSSELKDVVFDSLIHVEFEADQESYLYAKDLIDAIGKRIKTGRKGRATGFMAMQRVEMISRFAPIGLVIFVKDKNHPNSVALGLFNAFRNAKIPIEMEQRPRYNGTPCDFCLAVGIKPLPLD